MTKPVSIPNVFATSAGGNVPVSLLDADFTALQAAANDISTYNNYYVDTGSANAYFIALPAGLTVNSSNGLSVQFRAANANTGSSTLNAFGISGALLRPDGSPTQAGDIQSGRVLSAIFDTSANTWFLSTLASIPVGSAGSITYQNTISGSVSTTVQKALQNVLSVKTDFGAKGDGVTDDTAAINLALSSMTSGGVLLFPVGTYIVSASMTIPANVFILGSGTGATVISSTSLTADVFLLSNILSGIRLLTITGSLSRTAGRFIVCSAAGDSNWIEDLEIRNYFIGIELSGSIKFVKNIRFNNSVTGGGQAAIKISGGNDHFIDSVVCDNANKPQAGLLVTACNGSWINNCDFIHCQNGVLMQPIGSISITYMFFHNVACDLCTNVGWNLVTAGTALIVGCAFNNCWSASCTNTGFLTQGTGGAIDGLTFSNCRILNNGTDGFFFQTNTANVVINGGIVSGNSQTTPNTSAGIHIGANINDFMISGVRIGPASGFSDTQLKQISVDNGTGNNISIVGCDLRTGNAPLAFGPTGANNVIESNTGFLQTGFTNTTTNGSGQVTVNHNAGVPPKEVFFTVLNAANLVSAQLVSSNSTTFTAIFFTAGSTFINTGAVSFSWRISF